MWDYIFLGILQGIFEWIPISSEGIVAMASKILIQNLNPLDLSLFLHLGTTLAVLLYFRNDWKNVLTFKNLKLFRFLIISTLISLAVGYPLYKTVQNFIIGSGLLVMTGLGLLFTAFFQKAKRDSKIGFDKLAIITGFLQGLSVIPGFSRSGATVFGLSLGQISPSEILKVSYMMSVPVIITSSVYLFLKNPVILFEGWISLFFSFLAGILSLSFLMHFSKKINFSKFALFFSLLCFLGAIIEFLI